MLILDKHNKPIIIDSIYDPLPTDYMWVLDLNIMDYTLVPLPVLQEIVCSSIQIVIDGFEFILPTDWNILVYDNESFHLDVTEIGKTAGTEFTALLYGPDVTYPSLKTITATNYFIEHKNVAPVLNKHQMLCHPIGPKYWCSICPSDGFNKYLKDKDISDIIA